MSDAYKLLNNMFAPNDLKTRGLEVNAGDLAEDEGANVEYLDLLGASGFIVKGWTHLLAAYPKRGKTSLVLAAILRWTGFRVLYVTEESRALWVARFKRLGISPDDRRHITLVFGRALDPEEIRRRIEDGDEDIIVVDTARRLIGWRDESDNAELERCIAPFILACRDRTAIFIHHTRKGGGDDGEGIAGGHALMGLFDVALQLDRVTNAVNRRRLRGWGRVFEVPEVLIEMTEGGRLAVLGDPRDVSLREIEDRLRVVLTAEWRKQAEIEKDLGDPKPSGEHLRRALHDLAAKGEAERDPPLEVGSKPGARYRWRRAATSPTTLDRLVGGEVSGGDPPKPPAVGGEPHLQRGVSIVGGKVSVPPTPCRLCGTTRRWRLRDAPRARWTCGRCHPPAEGLDVEWNE